MRSRGGRQVNFTVAVRNAPRRPWPIQLKAVCGPGDYGEPVITVMLPEKD
jgi:hypothetical protein